MTTLSANQDGIITGKFQIPEGVPTGSKLVTFDGAATSASATFVGRGQITTNELRLINTRTTRRVLTWVDPLAQTFMLTANTQVAGVDLWFTAVGTTRLLMQIREVSQGIPTSVIVAEATKTPEQITVNGWTRFECDAVPLEANREYALIIMCNDAVSAVATANLGEFDVTAQQWVTSQPYQIGVLLSSSNNLTWTPHQTKDLAFRLLAPYYPPDNRTRSITLDPVAVTDIDQLLVLAAVERPTEDCDVLFVITAGAKTYTVSEAQPFTLDAPFTGTLTWRADLIGTATASPVLHRTIQLVAGKRLDDSNYISRALDTNVSPQALTVDINIYYDVFLNGGSVTPTLQDGASWAAMDLIAETELGDGWVERHYRLEDFTEPQTRVQLTLSGTAVNRPRVRNLRVAIT